MSESPQSMQQTASRRRSSPSRQFLLPPRTTNDEGEIRRVGFELEFSGPSLDVIAEIVARQFGGRIIKTSRYEQTVADTRAGDFRVEVDSAVLKDARYLDVLWSLGLERDKTALARMMENALEDVIEGIASQFVPCEVVTPPFPIDEMESLEGLRMQLMNRRAEGTRAAIHHAFGLHINPEVPSMDADDLLNHLRAFLLLYDWLIEVGKIDLARRLTPYIDDFPEVYRRHVLDPSYRPGIDQFTADYLTANPTRNRPLDLTPILAMGHADTVKAEVHGAELVSARPAYHYRLPNCQIDEPRWSISSEWNRWVLVERLAVVPEAIQELSHAYLQLSPSPINLHRRHWLDGITRWLQEVGWVDAR